MKFTMYDFNTWLCLVAGLPTIIHHANAFRRPHPLAASTVLMQTTCPLNTSVTLTVAQHPPRKWTDPYVDSATSLLRQSCSDEAKKSKRIIQSSVSQRLFDESHIAPSGNGFVWAAIKAYSAHHHLVIRPEEVWFAILSQVSFYINAHAEELREFFVAHEGQKELEVVEDGSIGTVDFGALAQRMGDLIQENVKDPELQKWITPDWTTTTDNDRTTAAILMMGSMKAYFSYTFKLVCGVPSVTLLGVREDWEDMLSRLDKLGKLGDEPAAFAALLRPVLRHFVMTFDAEPSAGVISFWDRIAHVDSRLSGHTFLSGWITAFCFWDMDGKRLYQGSLLGGESDAHWKKEYTKYGSGLVLDGMEYHVIDTEDVPAGYASVPVKVDDNGVIFNTTMVAGLIGMQVSSSGDMLDESRRHDDDGGYEYNAQGKLVKSTYVPGKPTGMPGLDTVQPLAGWFMYEVKKEEDREEVLSGEQIVLEEWEREMRWADVDISGDFEEDE